MRIRTLVPALACLAAAPLANAADPEVKIDGFVDSILSGSSVIDDDAKDGPGSNTEFSYAAKLGVAATISEKVSAQVDLVISGSSVSGGDYDSDGEADASTNQVSVRQAYGVWKLTSDVELKTGKFISNYGWIAAYAPGLYRVGAGPIVAFYGVDQVGADVKYSKDNITAAVTVANGFFGEGDNGAQSNVGQKDQAFAVGLDVVYGFGDKGSFNVEAIYDLDVNPAGGDGIHLAANATITPDDKITAAAELIYQTVGLADGVSGPTDADIDHLGLMGMVNYKLGDTLAGPTSVTGMVQYVTVSNSEFVKDADESVLELAAAVLTNPAGTDKLGLNFELAYAMAESETSGSPSSEESTVTASAELLYVF
jgi:hypothetical protein